jgi:hypothetical protein
MNSKTTETGPYSDEEFNTEFVRTQRSDWVHTLVRALTLVAVFYILARGVIVHGLTAGYLILPVAIEFVFVMWVGIFLSKFVIDCPKFVSTNKPNIAMFWTLVVVAVISIRLAWNGDAEQIDFNRIQPGWVTVWQRTLESGLIWALVAEMLGLIVATVPEVIRWRQVGGSFLWTTTFGFALRFTVMLLGGVVLVFLLMMLADSVGMWIFQKPNGFTWLVYGFLLFVEVGALVFGVFWHRDLKTQDPQAAS